MTAVKQAEMWPTPTENQDSGYLSGVQVLRFFAALAVVFAHIQHEIIKSRLFEDFRPFNSIDGGFGVDIFFVISGFIMLHVSRQKFGKSGATADFLKRRFLRIAPLYYIATTLTLAAILLLDDDIISNTITPIRVLASFTFFPSLSSNGEITPILKLGWTLNFEFFFYAIFSISMIFRIKTGLIFLTVALTAVVMIANCVPHPPTWLSFWGQSLVFEFLGGVALAMLYQSDKRVNRSHAFALIIIGIGLVISLKATGAVSYLPRAVFAGVPALLIVSSIILVNFPNQEGKLTRILSIGGEASYAIYLFHPFIIKFGTIIYNKHIINIPPYFYILIIVTVSIFAALFINLKVEKPLDKLLRTMVLYSKIT